MRRGLFPTLGAFPLWPDRTGLQWRGGMFRVLIASLGTAAGPGRSAGPQPVGIQSITDFATSRSALDSGSFDMTPQTRSLRIGEDRHLHYLVALMAEKLERLG
jgi:hypothetical protein